MRWQEVCSAYPNQWLVIEALESHVEQVRGQEQVQRRVFDRVDVIELCADGRAAMHSYREQRHLHPGREFLCIHTAYPSLEFEERPWRDSSPCIEVRAER